MNQPLDRISALPNGFFDVNSLNIRSVFPQPTLIQLEGTDPRVLFVAILQHGNEHSGLSVIQQVLKKFNQGLPRSLVLFVGNVRAAEADRRFLADQDDYNRCWPSTKRAASTTTDLIKSVFETLPQNGLFATIDLHNNTGKNPHYACITDPNPQNQHLAARFNQVAMVINRQGLMTKAFDHICPAVTLECGVPGDPAGIEQATRFIEDMLTMSEVSNEPTEAQNLRLVASHAMLNIPDDVSFAFDPNANADLWFEPNFEDRNFTLLGPEQIFGYTKIERPLCITDADGLDITDAMVRVEAGRIYLRQTMMPAMITRNQEVVRQDCLCYLLQDYPATAQPMLV